MSSNPDTRPSEIARIAKLANGDPYRFEILILLTENKEANKRILDRINAHELLDDTRLSAINNSISELKSGLGSAVSGVNNYKQDRYTFNGIKIAIWTICAVIATVLGLAIAAGYIGK